jgi:hypothetical protein
MDKMRRYLNTPRAFFSPLQLSSALFCIIAALCYTLSEDRIKKANLP